MANHLIEELDQKGYRNFALSFGAIVATLFGVIFPWILAASFPVWPWLLWSILAFWGLLAPMTLRLFYRAWMKFGLLLSKVTTPLVLGIVYYAVITPTGLIASLFRSDPLQRDCKLDCDTYRVKSPQKSHEHMKNPF
ncbi:MAG: SxtJ family membrane protein [Halioglobus sp.]